MLLTSPRLHRLGFPSLLMGPAHIAHRPAVATGETRLQALGRGLGSLREPALVGGQLGSAPAHAGRCVLSLPGARTQPIAITFKPVT